MSLTYVRTNFRRQNCCPAVRLPSGSTSILRSDIFAEQGPMPFSARRSLRFPRCPAPRRHRCCRPHRSSSHRPVPRRHRLRPRKIRNQCRSSEEFRSQEVTACDGTFPDFATSPYGFDTRIGRCSFARRKKAVFLLPRPQAVHLPDTTTLCFAESGRDRVPACPAPRRSLGFTARRTFVTSLPWSHPGSDPWRPSRGTGYG